MIDPHKVLGFLNITGTWDPALLFVIGGALLVFMSGYQLLVKNRKLALNQAPMQIPTHSKVDLALIIGAAIFGIGWGLGGICPGPALVNLLSGSIGIFGVFIAMLAGMAGVHAWQVLLTAHTSRKIPSCNISSSCHKHSAIPSTIADDNVSIVLACRNRIASAGLTITPASTRTAGDLAVFSTIKSSNS